MLALCSVLSALGVILIYLGSVFDVLDMSMAVLASLTVIVLVIECGGAYPWLVYAVTSILSLILVPNKASVLSYAFFMGFYPIVKEKIERIPLRLVRFVVKLAVFNACMVLIWWLAQLMIGGMTFDMPVFVVLLLLNVIFVFYDYALSVMITAYLRIWRKKLRIDKFFEG